MNTLNAENILIGTSILLISSGLSRSINKSKSSSLDTCARTQLNLGLSTSCIYGIYLILISLDKLKLK